MSVKVATWNANSIRTRLSQLAEWLARVAPDVLAIQETKVQDKDFPAQVFADTGYHVVYRGQKAQGGVALATRAVAEGVSAGLNDGGPADEARLLHAVVGGIAYINTYVPQGREVASPHFQYKLEWFARLRDYVARRYAPDQPVIWLGDLNVAPEAIDVYDPKRLAGDVDFHPEARRALQAAAAWGFVDVFRQLHPGETGRYTYWDYCLPKAVEHNLGWRIDHILSTAPLAQRCTGAWIDVDARAAERPSDHTFLVAEFDL